VCRQFNIRGRVQGVFFRASTRDTAVRLGLGGHAKNLADGSVEVVVCGADGAVRQMAHWLREGPPLASVGAVDELPKDCAKPQGFKIS
jgi:acylphosphatase